MTTRTALSNLTAEDWVLATYLSLGAQEARVVALSRLDRSPRSNWVEETGSLPRYIEDIALALERKNGWSLSRCIPVAISRVKKWAAGGDDVEADTRAKAQAALAGWEALKARNRARMAKKGD